MSCRAVLAAVAVTACVGVALTVCATAQAYVYWANFGSTSIGRATLGGATSQDFIPATHPCGVAVDGAHVYWADTNSSLGSIGRASLDGSGADQTFITGVSQPCGVAVDGRYIYWANTDNDSIGRANLDGSGANQSFIGGLHSPCGVAVDAHHVYWGNASDGPSSTGVGKTIGRANLDGSGVNQNFVSGTDDACGVAVDSQHVFWANYGIGGIGTTIGRANLDGSKPDESFIAGISGPCGVAAGAGYLYWAGWGDDTIGRATTGGADIDRKFAATAMSPCGVAADSLGPPASATAGRPRLLAASESASRWRERRSSPGGAPVGTTFSFDLAAPSWLRLAFVRVLPHRRAAAGSLHLDLGAGRRRVRFDGRLGRRRLPPGLYLVTVTARASGGRVEMRRLRFTILPG